MLGRKNFRGICRKFYSFRFPLRPRGGGGGGLFSSRVSGCTGREEEDQGQELELPELSWHGAVEWIMTRAPDVSLQGKIGRDLNPRREEEDDWNWTSRRRGEEGTQLSSILMIFSLSSRKDSVLWEGPLAAGEGSVNLLLVLLEETQSGPAEEILRPSGAAGDFAAVSFFVCLAAAAFDVLCRHLERVESAGFSFSSAGPGDLQLLHRSDGVAERGKGFSP